MIILYMHFIFDDVNYNFELQEDFSWTAPCHIYMTFNSRVIDWYLCKSFAVWQYVLCCTNFSFLNSLVTFLRQMSDAVVDNVWWFFLLFCDAHKKSCYNTCILIKRHIQRGITQLCYSSSYSSSRKIKKIPTLSCFSEKSCIKKLHFMSNLLIHDNFFW